MDLSKFLGQSVVVKTTDGQKFEGVAAVYESPEDSDDGIPSIDIYHTRQFPSNPLTLTESEIISIEVQQHGQK